MVRTSYRCEVCNKEADSHEQAEACERKGEFPVMPVGTVYASWGVKNRKAASIHILGERREGVHVQEGTHYNLHFTASMRSNANYCGLAHIVVPEYAGKLESGAQLVEDPIEELKGHPCYESMVSILEILRQGENIETAVRKAEEKAEERRGIEHARGVMEYERAVLEARKKEN